MASSRASSLPRDRGSTQFSAIPQNLRDPGLTHPLSHFPKPVGVSLLTKAACLPMEIQCVEWPLREQARSHGIGGRLSSQPFRKTCGIRGQLILSAIPQNLWDPGSTHPLGHFPKPVRSGVNSPPQPFLKTCGSELAHEGGVSIAEDLVNVPPYSRASSLLQELRHLRVNVVSKPQSQPKIEQLLRAAFLATRRIRLQLLNPHFGLR